MGRKEGDLHNERLITTLIINRCNTFSMTQLYQLLILSNASPWHMNNSDIKWHFTSSEALTWA